MIDCSRHQFSIAFLKKLIDIASLFHLNRFHWHLTDDQGWRIPLDGWPKLASIAARRTELQYTDNRTYGRLYSKEETSIFKHMPMQGMYWWFLKLRHPAMPLPCLQPILSSDVPAARMRRKTVGVFSMMSCVQEATSFSNFSAMPSPKLPSFSALPISISAVMSARIQHGRSAPAASV